MALESIEAYENKIEELEAASYFWEGIHLSEKFSLSTEFIMYVLREIRAGRPTKEAVDIALGEWDIV